MTGWKPVPSFQTDPLPTNRTRGYGWGAGDERVVETTPGGHWHTRTMLAAIRPDGVIVEACLAFPGATDGAMFLMYIEQMLAPTLSCGDTDPKNGS